jgi:hypothetical protein
VETRSHAGAYLAAERAVCLIDTVQEMGDEWIFYFYDSVWISWCSGSHLCIY